MIDRLSYRQCRPTWGNPATGMTARYVTHPDLRLAFIQIVGEPGSVYVVSDEPLPASIVEAVAVVEKWRSEHGPTA